MSHPAKLPLALTSGDPAGIGPDITLTAWLARTTTHVPTFALFGDPEVMEKRAHALNLSVPIHECETIQEAEDVFQVALPIVAIAVRNPVQARTPDSENGPAIIAAIDAAVAAVAHGDARAVVTNPIAKSVLYDAGFTHPGHTEYLASLAAQHWQMPEPLPVMLLASDALRVAPVTIHIPLADVPAALSAQLIERTARVLIESLRKDFGIQRPRVAVTGLNPHAGEAGTIGQEDDLIILPVVEQLAFEGHRVTGPHPADTLFHDEARADYDAVLAMYHDQALIPIKTLAFDRGVNVTLGLPFVRTSPDHGTAFAIAGDGTASDRSLVEALRLADTIAKNRAASTRQQATPVTGTSQP